LLLVAAGVFFALIIAEFAVRIYEGDPLWPIIPPEPYIDGEIMYQPSPTRRYELQPGVEDTVGANQVHIRINSAGFRDENDYPAAKPPGTYRIIVLGDSFTFAGKVASPETFTERLETALNQSDPSGRFEVLNWSIPGYNTEQEMLLLKEKGLAYQPDLVIVSFILNDALPMGNLAGRTSNFPLPVRRVLKRSYLVQFVYNNYVRLSAISRGASFKEDADLAGLAPGTATWQKVEDSLAEMKSLTSQNNARLLVVIWPMFVNLDDSYPYKDKHELVSQGCQSLGIPVLDLFPTFKGQPVESLWVARNDHHPNRLAQQMAAEATFQALTSQKLITSPAAH
jgi:hypothetical protein